MAAAEEHLRRALAIRQSLAPGSFREAESLHGLGLVYRRSGPPERSRELLCQAVDALEKQRGKLGGGEQGKTTFAAKYTVYYRDCADALIEQGQAPEAFRVLERSRARALLEMLTERDLVFAADVPQDVARERKIADAEYDRTQEALGKLSPGKDDAEIARLLGRLHELRERQREIAARIHEASPHYAALQYPEPLDLAGARGALDAGTALLAYSVGKEKTRLFVVEPAGMPGSGLTVLTLPEGEEGLRKKVEAFRTLIQRGKGDEAVLRAKGAELYDLLVRPAEGLIAPAQRVLVSPDGPLHTLPFAALVRKAAGKGASAWGYLVEWKPLHVVVSSTVYAELRKARREGASTAAVLEAFGDPKYPPLTKERADEVADPELRALTRGFSPTPLPFSRQEVDAIAGLYPGRATAHLGEEATEERAKAVGKDVRYVHFAVHGRLNERFPLDSALVLSIPEHPAEGQDNGLLQAWEVFERVRIDADLVTLSACETALGAEMGGEGLVGLTRAFQYAGARSVLASLWSVSDRSTADLMERFYANLRSGMSKDEALRAAQIELTHLPGSHPFQWAAFQLIGDWK